MAGYAPATLYQRKMGREMNEYQKQNGLLFVKFSNCDEKFICDEKHEEFVKNHTWSKGHYGYPVSFIDGRPRTFHSLILFEKGKDVDHINRNTKDNRECNLRIVTHSENMFNRKLQSNNGSGTTGVYFWRNRWWAEIYVNSKKIRLGSYRTKEEAIQERQNAETQYYGYLKEG